MSFLFAWGLGCLLMYYGYTSGDGSLITASHVWFAAAFVISTLRARR